MKIKVLGPGCLRCEALKEATKKALSELEMNEEIEEVKEMSKIIEYPIMLTPALVVNEKVVLSGEVPTVEEIKKLLKKEIYE